MRYLDKTLAVGLGKSKKEEREKHCICGERERGRREKWLWKEIIFIGFVVIKGVHIYAIWPSHICMCMYVIHVSVLTRVSCMFMYIIYHT